MPASTARPLGRATPARDRPESGAWGRVRMPGSSRGGRLAVHPATGDRYPSPLAPCRGASSSATSTADARGCRAELETLLPRLRFDPARDELFSVGDLVNRGPASLGALRLAKELGAKAVLGNHDVHLLQRAAGLRKEKPGDTLEDLLR